MSERAKKILSAVSVAAAVEGIVPAIDRGPGVAIEMLVIAMPVRLIPAEALIRFPIVDMAIEGIPAPARIVRQEADPGLEPLDAELDVGGFPAVEHVEPRLQAPGLLAQLLRFL